MINTSLKSFRASCLHDSALVASSGSHLVNIHKIIQENSHMNYIKIVLSLFVFIPFLLQASDPCSDIQLSAQVFLCSKVTFEHSDSELNNTYKNLLSTVRKEYSAQPDLAVEYIEKIKSSQRAWINFRDTNCATYSFQIDEKSQAYETTMYSCKNDMTRERIEGLKNILAQ